MRIAKAKEKGYTHNGLMYGFIPIYLRHVGLHIDVVGKNKIWDVLLAAIFLTIDDLCSEGGGFYVWEGEEL